VQAGVHDQSSSAPDLGLVMTEAASGILVKS
jgi:hypothetical protein